MKKLLSLVLVLSVMLGATSLALAQGPSGELEIFSWWAGDEGPALEALIARYSELNPDVEVSISWIDSWTDIAKMKEAANAAIATGADVVLPVASGASPGGLYAADEAGVWGIGYSGDQYVFAPDVTLSSGIVDTGLSIEKVVDVIVAGEFTHTDYWYGLKDNVVRMAPYHNTESEIPQDVKDTISEWTEKILSGEYEVPIKMEF